MTSPDTPHDTRSTHDDTGRTSDDTGRTPDPILDPWLEVAGLGVILDEEAEFEIRLKAMHDREPEEWQAPAAEILSGLERLIDAVRLADPPLVSGLRGRCSWLRAPGGQSRSAGSSSRSG